MLSFHATKLFNTIEGGALIVKSDAQKKQVDYLKNFGIKNETEVIMPGINGKMNEFQAAMGLLNLKLISGEQEKRRLVGNAYRNALSDIEGLSFFNLPQNVTNSEQYLVIRIDEDILPGMRDKLYFRLKDYNVHTRRYFYPLCSEAECYRSLPSSKPSSLPVASRVSREVLALPYYGDLGVFNAYQISDFICGIISEV
jgi:dTDP-4-amino-4,6-dideoxygalactose transaminase